MSLLTSQIVLYSLPLCRKDVWVVASWELTCEKHPFHGFVTAHTAAADGENMLPAHIACENGGLNQGHKH